MKKLPLIPLLSVLLTVLIVAAITAKDYQDQSHSHAQTAVTPSFALLGPCTTNCSSSSTPVGATSSSSSSSSVITTSSSSAPALASSNQPPCTSLNLLQSAMAPHTPNQRRDSDRGGFLEALFELLAAFLQLILDNGNLNTGTGSSTPCTTAISTAPVVASPAPASSSSSSISSSSSSSSATSSASGSAYPLVKTANWAGYESDAVVPVNTTVSSDWTVTDVDCSAGLGGINQWVGQGGSNGDSNLPQLGTETQCRPGTSGGSPTKYAYPWTERFPDPPVSLTNSANVGDKMTALVTNQGGGKFATTIKNITQGWSVDTPLTYTGYNTVNSAEVITEAYLDNTPGYNTSYDVILKFPDATYTNSYYGTNGQNQPFASAPKIMKDVDYAGPKSTIGQNLSIDTGPLNGTTFTNIWKHN